MDDIFRDLEDQCSSMFDNTVENIGEWQDEHE